MGLPTISPSGLARRMRGGPVTVIDVNARPSWERARVPGALHLDPTAYTESELPRDKDAVLVFYCSGPLCRKAPNAARRAKGMGYTRVQVMSAGIRGWLGAGLATESGAPA